MPSTQTQPLTADAAAGIDITALYRWYRNSANSTDYPPNWITYTRPIISVPTSTHIETTPLESPSQPVQTPVEPAPLPPPLPPPRTMLTEFTNNGGVYNGLHGCVIKYKGDYVRVRVTDYYSVNGTGIEFQKVKTDDVLTVAPGDVLMSDIEYVNKIAAYVKLPHGSGDGYKYHEWSDRGMKSIYVNNIQNAKKLVDALEGNYKSREEVLNLLGKSVIEKTELIPFHRDYAFNRISLYSVILEHKGIFIGEAIAKDGLTIQDFKIYPSSDRMVRQIKQDLNVTLDVFQVN